MINQRNGLVLDSPNLQGSCWITRIINTLSLKRHSTTIITEVIKSWKELKQNMRTLPRMSRILRVASTLSSMLSKEAAVSITTWMTSDAKCQSLSSSSLTLTSLQQEASNLNIQVKCRLKSRIGFLHLTRNLKGLWGKPLTSPSPLPSVEQTKAEITISSIVTSSKQALRFHSCQNQIIQLRISTHPWTCARSATSR